MLEPGKADRAAKPSLAESFFGSTRELGVLFGQSPVPMVFSDGELRIKYANAAFRQELGLPGETLTGRRLSEIEHGMNAALIERSLTKQVINRGVPVVDVHLEKTLAGTRRVMSWSAYPVTDNGQVLGTVGSLLDITDRVQAATALRQANARLDLLQRAGSQIGTTLDVYRTADELAALQVLNCGG